MFFVPSPPSPLPLPLFPLTHPLSSPHADLVLSRVDANLALSPRRRPPRPLAHHGEDRQGGAQATGRGAMGERGEGGGVVVRRVMGRGGRVGGGEVRLGLGAAEVMGGGGVGASGVLYRLRRRPLYRLRLPSASPARLRQAREEVPQEAGVLPEALRPRLGPLFLLLSPSLRSLSRRPPPPPPPPLPPPLQPPLPHLSLPLAHLSPRPSSFSPSRRSLSDARLRRLLRPHSPSASPSSPASATSTGSTGSVVAPSTGSVIHRPCPHAFAKREKQSLKKLESSLKLYTPDLAPALAI